MPVDALTQAQMREGAHLITTKVWNVTPRRIVATAQINGTPTSFPLQSLAIDNTTGDWSALEDGQYFMIGTTPGGHDVTVGVIAAGTTSSVMKIDEKSYGDAGLARNICKPIEDGQYVTALKYFPVWGRLSKAIATGQLKMGVIPYTDQNANPAPVANIGPWRREMVNPITGTAIIAFDAMPPAPSNPGDVDRRSFAYKGKTIVGFLWDTDDQPLVDGFDETDSYIEVECEPGFYVFGCTVTDSGGKSHKARTNVWVRTPTGEHADYSRRRQILGGQGVKTNPKGGEVSLTILGDTSDLFPGAAWLYTEEDLFSGAPVPAGTIVDSFCGYSTDDQINHSRSTPRLRVTIKSPMTLRRDLPTASQLLVEAAAPRNWQQIIPALSSVGYIADHILRWHLPAILSNHDFVLPPDHTRLRKFSYELNGTTIEGHLESLEAMALGNIGSLSDGTTLFCFEPWYFELAAKNVMDPHWTWGRPDFTGDLNIQRRHRSSVRWAIVYSMTYNGNDPIPFAARAPGGAAAQGTNEPTIPIVILPPDRGLIGTRQIAGHYFARENREITTITLEVNRNLDIAEPANRMRWHFIDVTIHGQQYFYRALPLEVSRTWQRGLKKILVTFDLDSIGLPGEELPLVRGGGAIAPGYDGSWQNNEPGLYPEAAPELDVLPAYQYGAAVNRLGVFGFTRNLLSKKPHWVKSGASYLGKGRDLAPDINSPFVDTGSGAFEAWAITIDETNLLARIYAIADLTAAAPALSAIEQFSMAAGAHIWGRIFMPASVPGLIIAGWKSDAGSYVVYSTDNGDNWSGVTTVGTDGGGTVNRGATLGMAVLGERVAIIAPNGDVGADDKQEYSIYYKNTTGGGFSEVVNIPLGWRVVPGCLTFMDAGSGVLFCALEKPWTPPNPLLDVVTFDSGGYPEYTLDGPIVGGSFGESTADGFPEEGDCAYCQFSAGGSTSTFVDIEVDLGDEYIVHGVSFRRKVDYPNGLFDGTDVTFQTIVYYYNAAGVLFQSEIIEDFEFNSVAGQDPDLPTDAFYARSTTELPAQPVRAVVVRMAITTADSTSLTPSYVNDIDITATLVEKTRQLALYSITNLNTTPAWQLNATPDDRVPLHHYALAVDAANVLNMEMLGTADNDTRARLTSDDSGTTWEQRETVPYLVGVKRAGSLYMNFGFGELRLSDNAGASTYNRIGDWARSVGPIDILDGAWVAF